MLFGASYYREYQPVDRLAEDTRLMGEAGVNFVRMGDSIWSLSEPEDGRIDLAWLDPVLDALHEAGIRAALVTPTYAIPPWLRRKHPELMAHRATGQAVGFGGRQNADFTHPAYRFHAERIIRAVAGRFAAHPAVVGWQVDNETGNEILHNPGVFARFVDALRREFGTVDRLNEVWGLTYWSHRLHGWEDLWTPDGNTNPGYDLAWRRFQDGLTTEFLAWQVAIVKEYARPDQWVTQDLAGGHGRPASDRYEVAQVVDILSENPYHPTQDGLAIPTPETAAAGVPEWMPEVGPWTVSFRGDLGRSGRQTNFFVTETNALGVGGPAANYPAYDNQWRQVAYTFISRGANAIVYWPWQTIPYGAETFWGGMLPHDGAPNRCFRELSRLGRELRCHGDRLTDLEPEAEVGLLYSQASKHALRFQPCLTLPAQATPDRRSYERIFDACYRACFDAGAQTAIVHPAQAWERLPVLVVPALYAAADALLDRLVGYAEGGGHLLLTFKSGYADEYARVRWRRAPGVLRPAVGAAYGEYSNLARPLAVRAADGSDFAVPEGARAEAWADGLESEGAAPLAFYDHPHFGRWPAVTSQPFGRGRVTYVGTLPNPALGAALTGWVMAQAGLSPRIADMPEPLRAATARNRDGERLWFLTNWSATEQTVPALPAAGVDLLTDEPVGSGDPLALGPWDVRILVER
jgi:beta-galactosidase